LSQVYGNLEPGVGDIDLGNRYGLAFSSNGVRAPAVGDTISVPLRINFGTSGAYFTFTSFNMYYPSEWLRVTDMSFSLPTDYTAGNERWCSNTTLGVIRCQASSGYSTSLLRNNVAYTIATIKFAVVNATPGVGYFTLPQYSTGLATSSTSTLQYPVLGGVAVAGPGPASFNGGTVDSGDRRRRVSVSGTDTRARLDKRNVCSTCLIAKSSAQCSAGLCTAQCHGDANADCVFNGGDVSYVQTVLLNQPVSPAYSTISAWQRRQLTPLFGVYDSAFDPNLCTGGTYVDRSTPCPTNNDAIQLTYILAGYSLFLDLPTPSALIESNSASGFTLRAPFVDENGSPCATSACDGITSALVRFEFDTANLTFTTAAGAATATSSGVMVQAAASDGAYRVSVAGPFSVDSISVVVLLGTFPQTDQSQRAFFSSPVYGTAATAFRPFVTVPTGAAPLTTAQ